MSKNQIIFLSSAALCVALMYFGCDTKGSQQKEVENIRNQNLEATSVDNIIREARTALTDEQKSYVEALQMDVTAAEGDTLKSIEKTKNLSATWYELGYPSLAGYYAEEVALKAGTEDTWSVAGTTYSICVQNTADEKEKQYCSKRAVLAFEKAISLAPEKIAPRINLALCYVDNPPADNPMTGILMLRELDSKYPDNPMVLTQLGRLAIKTNQFDKAKERLERVYTLDPQNSVAICLLAEVYRQLNDVKAEDFTNKCKL